MKPETCSICDGKKYIYRGFYRVAGGYVQCPECNAVIPKVWFMQPLGQSINSPTAKDADGGDLQVKDQT